MKEFKFLLYHLKIMKYVARIEVSLKSEHRNPEGEIIVHLLKDLCYPVEKVDVSKVYTITLQASSMAEAKVKAEEMSECLLANSARDNYTISVVGQ
jgi:phosphoribosylformylglycinamidine synthase PurS subunit